MAVANKRSSHPVVFWTGLVTGLAALIVLVSMVFGRLRKRRANMN